jgi:hypothetical protein
MTERKCERIPRPRMAPWDWGLALIALVSPVAATGQDLSPVAGVAGPYSGGPSMSLDAVAAWEGTCGGTSTRACLAAPSVPQLQHTLSFDELPLLASSDFTLAPVDGNATAPGASAPGGADVDQSALAQQANNPIANLISVPVENDWDVGIGPAHATRYLANIEPVIPFSLNEDWNLITRTIVPVIDQQALVNTPNPPATLRKNHSGLGDIEQSFFFSPKKEFDGWIIGAGPVGYYPTATDSALGLGKWGAGPTFVVLRQEHGFTYGLLANQIWSVGGQQGRANFSSMYLQPFLLYTTKSNTSLGVDSESSHDWYDDQWIVPLNFQIRQLLKIGKLPVQFTAGYRYYLVRPTGDANWGLRFTVTLLFPKKPP